ncbi:MAG: CopD family protein [Gammaproteobacteria bacterium]|nr:CopD family protein [Gammaproteobacteria bacterium]
MLWTKALHLVFMVTWFAGLFYLPRLFVYHAMAEDRTGIERFKTMERKLFWGIATPGGILTLVFGGWTLVLGDAGQYAGMLWMQLKLLLVAALVVYHICCGYLLREFSFDRNRHGHVWYRWFNEIPVLLLIGIVFLAVFKPL